MNDQSTLSLDALTEDQLLMRWQHLKDAVETAKAAEMDLRKYIVSRAFPNKTEGANIKELGAGYSLKAGIKYNYNLDPDNKKVQEALDRIRKIGNEGTFIADRIVSWKPTFVLTEYRALLEDKSETATQILGIVHDILTITEAAPSLEIKSPKVKK
jgi:hypothetical protein